MQPVYELIAAAAARKVNVLIYGETGVGKELVARAIHQLSDRRGQPLVIVNCGAITETLFEQEFFGHRKGAFTGADRDYAGFFASAHHGTLFLDEIGELSPVMQVKLLRSIETGEYTPVGDTHSRTADVHIIAATNHNPDQMLEDGTMRDDFYYRICILRIAVPPLRERREDIPLLIEYFLRQYNQNSPPDGLPRTLFNEFCAYDWPGNVRQLQTEIQRYLATGHLTFPPTTASMESEPVSPLPDVSAAQMRTNLLQTASALAEKQMIQNALRQTSGRKEKAAALLGINRRTLYKKIKRHGIE